MEDTMAETKPEFVFENVEDGETIYQRCLIIKARFSPAADAPSMVTVEQSAEPFDALFPSQTWPVEEGNTKIIVMLSVGPNLFSVHPTSDATTTYNLRLTYAPDMRLPPLHLAVMFGSDSQLMIDYERNKVHLGHPGSIGSAVARFRMTAYMWQAMIAEDMRQNGLGRRSFRLDESWNVDTTSARFTHAARNDESFDLGATRNTAKVSLVRSEHSVEEIRDARFAQDNPLGTNSKRLHTWFLEAFHMQFTATGIYSWSARPIIAGLIIDAAWSEDDQFALGHAALGSHDRTGVSLCTIGSRLMYAWPEHLEDIQGCLTDVSRPEDGVVSHGREGAGTMWEVCSIGQTEFLHQLGHAFGAGHTPGIMKGGCASHWPRHFVPRTAPSTLTGEVGIVVDQHTTNDAVFDIKDLLTFKLLPHFWMEGDEKAQGNPLALREILPDVSITNSSDEDGNIVPRLVAASPAQIVRVLWNGEAGAVGPSIADPSGGVSIAVSEIVAEFSRDEPLRIAFLGGNGQERVVTNFWTLLEDPATLRIPGSDIVLHRRSIMCENLEEGMEGMDNMNFWSWATLLSRRMDHGTIMRANEINICIGEYLLGLYVRFQNGIRVNCGPRFESQAGGKYEKHFGGRRKDCLIPPSHEVARVEVSRGVHGLRGLNIHLSNGEVTGSMAVGNLYQDIFGLEPPSGERIVGFYGRSYFAGDLEGIVEFGIITAPSDVELPAQVYDMPQLQNTDGGLTEADYHRDDDPQAIVPGGSVSSEDPLDPPSHPPSDVNNSDDELMAGVGGVDFTGWHLDG